MTDNLWPRRLPLLDKRAFDAAAVLRMVEASVDSEAVELTNYDPATKTTTRTPGTFHILRNSWSAAFREPNFTRDEAWVVYVLLWKREVISVAEATAEPLPTDILGRIRSDLQNRVLPPWFDPRTFWCSVLGLLNANELVQLIGDARIFAHSYKEGGTSIITSYSDRIRFAEEFYQVVVPRLTADQWQGVADLLRAAAPLAALVAAANDDEDRLPLTNARLRLAAASGEFDDELLGLLAAMQKASLDTFDILHALRDPSHLRMHASRLGIELLAESTLTKWVDRFGASEPEFIIKGMLQVANKKNADALVATLVRLLGAEPAALATILSQVTDSKGGAAAQKWLQKYSKAAAPPKTTKTRPPN